MRFSAQTIKAMEDWFNARYASKFLYGYPGEPDGSGGYTFDVPGKPGQIAVRVWENDTMVVRSATNFGAIPNPALMVRMTRVNGELVIDMPVPQAAEELYGAYSSIAAAPPRVSAIGSGADDLVEDRRMMPALVHPSPNGGLLLYVQPFAYWNGTLYVTLGGVEFDPTSPTDYRAVTSGYKAPVVIGLQPSTNTIVAVQGDLEYEDEAVSFTREQYEAIAAAETDFIPLLGLPLSNGQTEYTAQNYAVDMISLRPWLMNPQPILDEALDALNSKAIMKLPSDSGSGIGNMITAEDGYSSLIVCGTSGGSYPEYPWFRVGYGSDGMPPYAIVIYQKGDMQVANMYYIASSAATGIGTSTPSDRSILDVHSTTKASRPFPLMTEAERDAISGLDPLHTGLGVTNSDTGKINIWDGAAWTEAGGGGGGSLTVEEADESPSVTATTIKFPDASLTNEGSGVVRYRVQQQLVFAVAGDLTVAGQPFRISNNFGRTLTIKGVYLNVNTAPTGASIIVDVNKNGTTIFTTQANRPAIAASANSGSSTTIDVTSWAASDYLTMDVDQIGSTIAGANLTVHVLVEG